MFVVITEPDTDEVVYSRQLGPNENINDCRKFADRYAESIGVEIAEPDGHIPNCCGDIRVEIRLRKKDSLHIWTGESFYFKRED